MGKRVLIVNDSFGERMVLRDYLVSIGYSVVGEARHGQESVDKYKDLRPDLVVMDTAMPHMDGVAATRRIIQEDQDANIVICTGRGQRTLAIEALNAGAREIITKPYNIRRMKRVLHSMIG